MTKPALLIGGFLLLATGTSASIGFWAGSGTDRASIGPLILAVLGGLGLGAVGVIVNNLEMMTKPKSERRIRPHPVFLLPLAGALIGVVLADQGA